MTDLLRYPYYRPEDLGQPMPAWPHATSVCLPTWEDNIGYEEGDPRVVGRLQCGYPRFVYHPFVVELCSRWKQTLGLKDDSFCAIFPSRQSASHCVDLLDARSAANVTLHDLDVHGLCAISLPLIYKEAAKFFWQHAGEGISSRLAQAALEHRSAPDTLAVQAAKGQLRQRIAQGYGAETDDVYLFPSGMAAFFAIFRVVKRLFPGRKTVQFGFPYVDALKIQQKYGAGVHFYPRGDDGESDSLEQTLRNEPIAGLFCEFPMNPLMRSPNLQRLATIAGACQVPLIVDDTVGTWHNVSVLPPADVVVTSLTKFFSGVGDVTAGSAVLHSGSALYDALKQGMEQEYEDALWGEDALALEVNSRDFASRMTRINDTAERLCDHLVGHSAVEHVYFAKYETADYYRAYQRTNGGGYSGLFSILLKHAEASTVRVFNHLKLSKGPSFGTNFSLCCPYTLLAHYHELDFAERCGVSRYLLRVSVGLEPADNLIARFEEALDFARV